MTRHLEPSHEDQVVHHQLSQHHHALTRTLDELLDVEAGLQEVLLHSHHDTATHDLGTILDTEAGLAAILPPAPRTPPGHRCTPTAHSDAEAFLRTLSPAGRLALRSHRAVKKAIRALDSALTLDRKVDRDLTLDLTLDLARDLALTLNSDLLSTRDRDQHLLRDLVLARNLIHDLDRVLTLGRHHDPALTQGLELARSRARDLALDSDIDRDPNRARARNRARDLDRALTLALNRGRDVDDDDLNFIVTVRHSEVSRTIELTLDREVPVLDEHSLHTLLDDFTTADLRNTDLAGIDLGGIHWSQHSTQWPPATDVEDLKTRSDEAPPGSGTWIIRSGTAPIRDHAEL
ncbi:hypothetical protein ACFW91_33810 [Streptomyces asoensis]|uniref:hypothetical protein n=1 Tax=Streptomyces asoensis TaxID=249586 RepID=UPI003685E87B